MLNSATRLACFLINLILMFQIYFSARKLIVYALVCTAGMFQPFVVFSQTPALHFSLVASGLSDPVDIVHSGDGSNRLFVVEKTGKIRIISGGVLLANSFLDLSELVSSSGEQGLLSLAFHPQYASNKYFFVYYVNTAGNIVVARYQTSSDPLVAMVNSGQVLLTIPHPVNGNHNGGKLNFGIDGNLYFGTGDGGGAGDQPNNAQNGNSLLGKMIRINVDNFATSAPFYIIPADNPYNSDPNVRDEIWALGLRNPFRWSFDRSTHDMWIADVGQDLWEEVNFRAAGNTGGINYGWRCYEATHAYNTSGCAAANNYVFPIFEYDHDYTTGGSSITGGFVYRGTNYPTLYGYYVMADYQSNNAWVIKPDGSGGWITTLQKGLPGGIVAFGEDENAELYAVSLSNNSVYQVQALNALPIKLVSFTVTPENGMHLIKWQINPGQDLRQFEIQYSNNGTNFQTIAVVQATHSNLSNKYQYNCRIPIGDKVFYRLKIVDNDGKDEYSNIINATGSDAQMVSVSPTLVKNNLLKISFNVPFKNVQVIDMNGRVLKSRNLGQSTGMIDLDVSDLAKGLYTIRFIGNNSSVYRKVVVQ